MIGDLFAGLLEGYVATRTPSRRWQIATRLFFGAVGCVLALVGTVVFLRRIEGTLPLRATFVLLFMSLGSFFLFNVLLFRTWKWPALLFVASFVAMFVVRLVWGA
jgi:hypothetical protein